MERERIEEIIAAYGADPARWPAEERDAARAGMSADLPLRRAVEDAAALDAMLGRWAAQGPADDEAAARATAEAALRAADRPARRWLPAGLFGGAAVAAAMAGALLLSPMQTTQTTPAAPKIAAQQVASTPTVDPVDSRIWAMTFTPTPDEETLI